MKSRSISRCVCTCLTLALTLQLGAVPVYAASPSEEVQTIAASSQSVWDELERELSRNGNPVTRYVNQDDHKEKTILWVKGINPPSMGDSKSPFVRQEKTYGNVTYITYEAPYLPGNHWYDVNKSGGADAFLCFAATASNGLHWWMEQNEDYIRQYLTNRPDDPKKSKIEGFLNSFQNQYSSKVFQHYIAQFGDRKNGYWSDLLLDNFINGYPYKEGGGTNDPEFDGPTLEQAEPNPYSGFFFDVFGRHTLARRHYDWSYDNISNNIKNALLEGKIIMVSYAMGGSAHIVTMWGAEFDLNGKISAVYLSDSDDPKEVGMYRYRVVPSGNRTRLTTDVTGQTGSFIDALVTLSQGEEYWERYLNITRHPLTLTWGNTEFTYNGTPQKPEVTFSGVQGKDDVQVSSFGAQTAAGNYTATTSLQGTDAKKYELPSNNTQRFVIYRANVGIEVKCNLEELETNNAITLLANVTGVNGEIPNGTVSFVGNGKSLGQAELQNGKAEFRWENPDFGSYQITATFSPERDMVSKNYKWTESSPVAVEFHKKDQLPLNFAPIEAKKYGDPSFQLTATGGSSNGSIIYSSDQPDVISIHDDMATITGIGTANLTATKLGDVVYNSVSATITVQVARGPEPNITYPSAADLTYGQTLAESALTGGSTNLGQFEWEDPTLVPHVGSTEQRVKFLPSPSTEQNYEPIRERTGTVAIKVNKAVPLVSLTSRTANDNGTASITLTAVVGKVGQGEPPQNGTVTFVDCVGDTETEIPGASIAIQNGTAVYTWTNVPQGQHRIKAIYSGDENYHTTVSLIVTTDITAPPEDVYSIRVDTDGNGTAVASHSSASKGTQITLTATPKDGFQFKEWTILEGQFTLTENTFTMPDMPVSIRAIFEKKDDPSNGGNNSGNSSGGGSSSSGGSNKPDPTQKPHDTTTETVKQPDGTVIKTVKNEDGSSVVEITKPDGASSITKISAEGKTNTKVTIPAKVGETAAQKGQTLPLPMPSVSTDKAPVVEVKVESTSHIKVSIPVEKATAGTVVVLVQPDGNRQVIRKSAVLESGVTLSVDSSVTLTLEERSKAFSDVKGHWAQDAIDFVSSREIYSGTSETEFSPDEALTRGMLVKALHNLENNPKANQDIPFTDVSSEAWFGDSVQWAVEAGIVKGVGNDQFAPEQNITREDLAVILYRYAGSPQVIEGERPFQDWDQVSQYADPALRWAIQSGIIQGVDNGTLNPKGTATRAQTAAMIMRLMDLIMK